MGDSREHNSRDVIVFTSPRYGARMRGMGVPWVLIRVIYSGVLEKIRYVTAVHHRTNTENMFEFVGHLSAKDLLRDLRTWF